MGSESYGSFSSFVGRFDRSDVADEAERVLREMVPGGGVLSVFGGSGDELIGFTLRQLAETDSPSRSTLDSLVERLVEHYGFPPGWLPPRLLVREALAHTVQRRRVIERLGRALDSSSDLCRVLDRAAVTLVRPEDAFLLDEESTDAVLEELRKGM